MVVMMDMEISCKGHCEKLSHFLDHVSHTVLLFTIHQGQFTFGSGCGIEEEISSVFTFASSLQLDLTFIAKQTKRLDKNYKEHHIGFSFDVTNKLQMLQ